MATTPTALPAVADVVSDPNQDKPAPTPVPSVDDEPVKFDERQQRKIDEIVRSAQGRAASETRQKLSVANHKISELEAQLQNAVAASKPDASEADRLRAELDAERAGRAAEKAQATKDKLDAAILNAASEAGFLNPPQALKLLRDNVRMGEDGNIVVTDDDGIPLENQSVKTFVTAYAQKNDHMIRGSVRGGSGSTPSNGAPPMPAIRCEEIFGRGSDSRLANACAIKNPAQYRVLRAEAIRRGLI